ncbi:hypothetical protein SAMN02745174_00656 [Cetobacterium ceti]|uniref:Uncharacterized protein n=1 Tax=Cetobacterium ceti TaxID=180163 RepID=A0A1T4KY74_9FUSO|nr:hypothetical protein [Cetobacterium ceti]SJZ47331.1 hypothetical protein SAMN02745174_00656 [Cetobacterium ceti]
MKKICLFVLMFATLLLSACSSTSDVNGSVPLDPNSHTVNNFVEGTQAEE